MPSGFAWFFAAAMLGGVLAGVALAARQVGHLERVGYRWRFGSHRRILALAVFRGLVLGVIGAFALYTVGATVAASLIV